MNYNRRVGQFGEDLARDYLLRNGYEIIERNKNTGHKEIDIIAKHKDVLVFVEVKARTSTNFGEADEAATAGKIRKVKRAMELYLEYNDLDYSDIRLDLIAVDIKKEEKTAKIKHYKDII